MTLSELGAALLDLGALLVKAVRFVVAKCRDLR